MVCCSKLTDVIPSIQTVSFRLSESAISPIKKVKERWSSPDVNSTIKRMRSRTWFGRESNGNNHSRVAPNPCRVADSASAAPPIARPTDEEFRAFVAEKRRKSAAENRRKSTDKIQEFRPTNRLNAVAPTGMSDETVEGVRSNIEDKETRILEHSKVPSRIIPAMRSKETQPQRLLNRQRSGEPRLRYVPSCESESETVSSTGNRLTGKPEMLQSSFFRNKSGELYGNYSTDASSFSRSRAIKRPLAVKTVLRKSEGVNMAAESTTDAAVTETDMSSTMDSSEPSFASYASLSSITTPSSLGYRSENSISYREAFHFKAAKDPPKQCPSVPSPQALERKRSSSIFITSLLRDASRKSQRGTVPGSSEASIASSTIPEQKEESTWPKSRSPSAKAFVVFPSEPREDRRNQRKESTQRRSFSENACIVSPKTVPKDRQPCAKRSTSHRPKYINKQRTWRKCHSPSAEGFSGLESPTPSSCDARRPRPPKGCRITRVRRRESMADDDCGYHQCPERNEGSDEETSQSVESPGDLPVMQEEDQEFAKWVDDRRRKRSSNRGRAKSTEMSSLGP